MTQTAYVGTTPFISDVILDAEGRTVPLTGATVTFVYRPFDQSAPAVSIAATIDPDQVGNPGGVSVQLASPIMDAASKWVFWWHVIFANATILDTGNDDLAVITHGPGPGSSPYLTPAAFRRITRVKLSKLGIQAGVGDELLQEEIDRAAAYVEFVTGQPATSRDLPVATTSIENGSPTMTSTATQMLIRQAIQMRTEQVTYQSQRSYLEDATDDVISSFSVGGYSQSKTDVGRRGEQRQLNSWSALSNVLWLLMTPERYGWWVIFLSGDAHLMLGAGYGFESTLQPSWIDGWGYGFGAADLLIASTGLLAGGQGVGGYGLGYGGLGVDPYPLPTD